MGTTLNARSPGLAAKMSSPKDMDISPAPLAPSQHLNLGPSPSEALPRLMDSIHVAPINERLHPLQAGSSRPRPAAFERKSSLQLAHSMSSRLFGAEIAFNSQRAFAREQDLLSSPDKEPPPKRRPNSLPTRQSEANERISQLSSALRGVVTAKPRQPLPSAFGSDETAFGAASSSRAGSSFAARNRLSDSSVQLGLRSSKRTSRTESAKSFFDEVENELGARPQNDEEEADLLESIDFNPSPSLSMASVSDTMAGYFFDPLSPEKLGSTLGMTPVAGPSLLAAMSNTAASPSVSSPPASSPCTRMPPPKRTTSLGVRSFQRANTLAAVPRAVSSSVAGPSTSSAGAIRTTLGKRANPYVKRPSLSKDQPAVKSVYPVLGISGQTNRVVRPTAPAPRRCYSALDQSSVLGGSYAAPGSSKLSRSAIESPVSPERRRTTLSSHMEMSDSNGSPIGPAMRARLQPRRGSKDDSSPLAYGTGMKRSGSRNSDTMVDEVILNNSSPASAESLPGFGASEKEGKILPCFNVKEDGLMRITPQTMTDLLAGKFTNAIMSYQVVDCRFGYEYEGGHIPGAINLSTVEKVVGHFLTPGQGRALPPRSQSGKADQHGNRKKHVLIFHCEFSAKRAPSMALALRQADRGLVHDYPNCHFPEIYVLQGGYCSFFKSYSNLCEPRQYIPMDDPRFLNQRSTELNGFRKQFSRHRSFTYGEGKRQTSLTTQQYLPSKGIQEEPSMEDSPCPRGLLTVETAKDTAGDTSFGSVGDSSIEDGLGDSPCAAAAGGKFLKPPSMGLPQARMGSLGARRPLLRAGTTGNILPRFMP